MSYLRDLLEWFDIKEFFDIMREMIVVSVCIIPIAIITTAIGMSDYGKTSVILIIALPIGLILERRRRAKHKEVRQQ